MKTKEEVIEYVKTHGHNAKTIDKIAGFLIGMGIKDENENVLFLRGTGTWSDFSNWFYSRPKKSNNDPILTLFALVFQELDNISDDDVARENELKGALDFLFDTFVIDTTHIEGSDKKVNHIKHRKTNVKDE